MQRTLQESGREEPKRRKYPRLPRTLFFMLIPVLIGTVVLVVRNLRGAAGSPARSSLEKIRKHRAHALEHIPSDQNAPMSSTVRRSRKDRRSVHLQTISNTTSVIQPDLNTAHTCKPGDIILVTSHFPATKHTHYLEIEAAIAANIMNPSIDTNVIVLETLDTFTCKEFRLRMKQLATGFWGASAVERNLRKLVCVERTSQPTYLELLVDYVNGTSCDGAVSILSNADIVFDAGLRRIGNLPPGNVYMFGVNAGPNMRSSPTFQHLKNLEGMQEHQHVLKDFYENVTGQPSCSHNLMCTDPGRSFDAFAFKMPFPPNLFDPVHRWFDLSDEVSAEDRSKLSFQNNPEVYPIYMNQMGSENRVTCAFRALGLQLHSVCYYIWVSAWHCAEKMHKTKKWVYGLSTRHIQYNLTHPEVLIRKKPRGEGRKGIVVETCRLGFPEQCQHDKSCLETLERGVEIAET